MCAAVIDVAIRCMEFVVGVSIAKGSRRENDSPATFEKTFEKTAAGAELRAEKGSGAVEIDGAALGRNPRCASRGG